MGIQQFTRPLSEFNQDQIDVIQNAVLQTNNTVDWSEYSLVKSVKSLAVASVLNAVTVLDVTGEGYLFSALSFGGSYSHYINIIIDGVSQYFSGQVMNFPTGIISMADIQAISGSLLIPNMGVLANYMRAIKGKTNNQNRVGATGFSIMPVPMHYSNSLQIRVSSATLQTINCNFDYVSK